MVGGDGARYGVAEGFDEVDGGTGCCVFEDYAEVGEAGVEGAEVGEEEGFGVEDVGVLNDYEREREGGGRRGLRWRGRWEFHRGG